MSVKQIARTFTCNYSEKEDRLLLSINYTEPTQRVDFWITRAFLLKILSHLSKYISFEKNQKESLRQDGAMPTDQSIFLLTQTTPVLLESIDLQHKENQHQILFKNNELQIYCEASLDTKTLENMATLLVEAAPKFEWGIHGY